MTVAHAGVQNPVAAANAAAQNKLFLIEVPYLTNFRENFSYRSKTPRQPRYNLKAYCWRGIIKHTIVGTT